METEIIKIINKGKVNISQDYMVNIRHKELLMQAVEYLIPLKNKKKEFNQEIFAFEIKECINSLEDILGRKFAENTLDMIFSRFCIGK